MKKRLFILLVFGMVGIFLLGMWSGSAVEIQRNEEHLGHRQALGVTIAVVNADIGIDVAGERQNFSAAIIETLGDEFVLVSPAMAQMGFREGIYGAVITFPSAVSAQVLSFNAQNPQRVQIDFLINPLLPERVYLDVHQRIIDLQQSINATLSHTFIASVFGELHTAQGNTHAIFQNDASTLDALDILYFTNFTADLQLEHLPEVPFEPEELDTSGYLQAFADFASNISGMYRSGWEIATRDYDRMSERVIALTDGFPEQKEAWLEELYAWTDHSVQYGIELGEFADYYEAHMYKLDLWRTEANEWIEAVEDYEEDVETWSDNVQAWFEVYAGWLDVHWAYWDAAVAFSEALDVHREDLYINQVKSALDEWEAKLLTFAENIESAFDLFNEQFAEAGTFFTDLYNWHSDLQEHHEGFEDWYADVHTARDDVQDYIDAMGADIPPEMDDLLLLVAALMDALDEDTPTLPNVPDEVDTQDWIYLEWDDSIDITPPTPIPALYFPAEPNIPERDDMVRPEMSEPPEYPERTSPGPVEEPPEPTRELPIHPEMMIGADGNPLINPPPQPDDFWAALEEKHDLLSTFDIADYLTDALIAQVDGMLGSYAAYLDTVRADVGAHFMANVALLFEVYVEYTMFLAGLRTDTLLAEAAEIENLHERIEAFFGITFENSADTLERLQHFSHILPESRDEAGINHNLVGFAVAPFEAVPPAAREGLEAAETGFRFMIPALWTLLALFTLTLIFCTILHHRAMKRAEKRESQPEKKGALR